MVIHIYLLYSAYENIVPKLYKLDKFVPIIHNVRYEHVVLLNMVAAIKYFKAFLLILFRN